MLFHYIIELFNKSALCITLLIYYKICNELYFFIQNGHRRHEKFPSCRKHRRIAKAKAK